MMDMCTALRRVRGTLLSRGPWVMDGQLLLGTRPALQGPTQGHMGMNKAHGTETQQPVEQTMTGGAANNHEPGGLLSVLGEKVQLHLCISGGSRLILALCSITSFATRPLL